MARERTLLLTTLFAGLFVMGIGTTVCSPVLIEMSRSVGASVDQVGAIFSIGPLGYLLGLLASLPATRRLGHRSLFSLIYLLAAAGAGIVGLAGSLAALCIGTAVLSFGSGLVMTRSLAVLGDMGERGSRLRLSLGTFSISLGAVCGAFLGPLAEAAGLGWPAAFWAMAGILMADMILLQTFVLPAPVQRAADGAYPPIGSALASLRGAIVLVMGLVVFLVFALELGISAWIPTILRLTRGFDLSAAGNTLAVFWGSMAAGRLLFGLLAERCHLLIVSLVLALLFLLSFAATLAAVPGCTMLFFGLCGFFITVLYTYALIVATEHLKERKGLVVTAFLILGEVGFLATNCLVVMLIRTCGIGGAQNAFLVLGVALVVALATAVALAEVEKRRLLRQEADGRRGVVGVAVPLVAEEDV